MEDDLELKKKEIENLKKKLIEHKLSFYKLLHKKKLNEKKEDKYYTNNRIISIKKELYNEIKKIKDLEYNNIIINNGNIIMNDDNIIIFEDNIIIIEDNIMMIENKRNEDNHDIIEDNSIENNDYIEDNSIKTNNTEEDNSIKTNNTEEDKSIESNSIEDNSIEDNNRINEMNRIIIENNNEIKNIINNIIKNIEYEYLDHEKFNIDDSDDKLFINYIEYLIKFSNIDFFQINEKKEIKNYNKRFLLRK